MDDAIGFVRASEAGVITPEDLARLRRLFDSNLIPMARAAQVVGPGTSFESLVARYSPEDPMFGVKDESTAREIAEHKLVTSAAWLQLATRLQAAPRASREVNPDRLNWQEVAYPAISLISHLFGYLSALLDSRMDTGRRATDGRRLIGATTREKVRKEAARYLGTGKAKEEVAALIAPLLGKSFGHVLKRLYEEFPGEKWKGAPSPDASIDTAGCNDG
jgi:hypothetical protein